ncbi:hypothetical protein K438DRAFT_1800239, partial [Mycena galopus ATCC 62051]
YHVPKAGVLHLNSCIKRVLWSEFPTPQPLHRLLQSSAGKPIPKIGLGGEQRPVMVQAIKKAQQQLGWKLSGVIVDKVKAARADSKKGPQKRFGELAFQCYPMELDGKFDLSSTSTHGTFWPAALQALASGQVAIINKDAGLTRFNPSRRLEVMKKIAADGGFNLASIAGEMRPVPSRFSARFSRSHTDSPLKENNITDGKDDRVAVARWMAQQPLDDEDEEDGDEDDEDEDEDEDDEDEDDEDEDDEDEDEDDEDEDDED